MKTEEETACGKAKERREVSARGDLGCKCKSAVSHTQELWQV
eukprot:CAMPEP_0116846084 /NCGR_PEP_ID=MMETSP0418-20121206/13639_1 /TAXON_ID=1158023 /ORGANISM="Astrosyne radiata, Strain 13vi08-1A" /LENGTH=41 /DNA_ID= /DNA_START= /DNA_END= /DNA_ORIENTATION=